MKGDSEVLKSDIQKKLKEALPVSTKQEYAYIEHPEGPKCGNCNRYIIGGKCTVVSGKIDPINGSCNYWSSRRTIPPCDFKCEDKYNQEQAGYVETKGAPQCGKCDYYREKRRCIKVAGDIDPIKGCCIRWEPIDQSSSSS